ncbi:hypothetical protein [Parashewanella tropica]|nr:hypothetical protein [Parashewanella tropica]
MSQINNKKNTLLKSQQKSTIHIEKNIGRYLGKVVYDWLNIKHLLKKGV